MPIAKPFSIIAGNGLGACYSSLAQVGPLNPLQGVGQAGILFYPNVVSGNLVIRDHILQVNDLAGIIELGYVYNSHGATSASLWKFAADKRFKQLPNPIYPPYTVNTGILIETDGHETVFSGARPDSVNFYAPAMNKAGKQCLYYDAILNYWTLFDPDTHAKEYYDAKGLLRKRCDMQGRSIYYNYDSNDQLTVISGDSGTSYKIVKTSNPTDKTDIVEIYQVVDGVETVLQRHLFDTQKRLTETQVNPSSTTPYKISYGYFGAAQGIVSVTQTDRSQIQFYYDNPNSPTAYVNSFKYGLFNNVNLTYNSATQVTYLDDEKNKTQLTLDSAGQIVAWQQQPGMVIDNLPPDVTQYQYTNSQITQIIHPDKSIEQFVYGSVYQQLTEHLGPDQQHTVLHYAPGGTGRQDKVDIEVHYCNGQPLVTYYVYDMNVDQTGQNHAFLRFVIRPSGQVTEYRPDSKLNIASARVYLKTIFKSNFYTPSYGPEYLALTEWVAAQDPSQVCLTDFTYDDYGQVQRSRTYNAVDATGNGIITPDMRETTVNKDVYGNWLERITLQSADLPPTTSTRELDFLQRQLKITDELGQVTTTQYIDAGNGDSKTSAQIMTTLPNGRVELQTLSKDGPLKAQQNTVDQSGVAVNRSTNIRLDRVARPVATLGPDGKNWYSFYDGEDRLLYKISPKGRVTQFVYDRQHRYQAQIDYAQLIDISKLDVNPSTTPNYGNLQALLAPLRQDPNNIVQYECFDAQGNSCYKIDADKYVQEQRYNEIRHYADINYKQKLTAAELTTLLAGGVLSRAPDLNNDRCKHFFYDDDGRKIADQDAAGYLTEYKRDIAGNIIEKIIYFNQTTFSLDPTVTLDQIRPATHPKDAHTYSVYNQKGLCIAEVDAEKYLTLYTYLACDLVSQSVRYANRLDMAQWLDKTQVPTVLPDPSSEDRKTLYQYDLKNREVERDVAYDADTLARANEPQKASKTQYDIMGHIVLKRIQDLASTADTTPDCVRGSETQYDGWEQISAVANPYVAAKLAAIDLDPNLTPAQKAQQQAEIWQEHSLRYQYEPTSGVKLSSTDPVNQAYQTFYYCDDEQQPIISIDPTGAIVETERDNFNYITMKRQYKTRLTQEQLETLSGGFMTTTVRQLLDSLKNDAIDAVTRYQPNRRGLNEVMIDPEGYTTQATFNAFRETETELLPVETTQPSLRIQHVRDNRGLEIQTIKQAGTAEPIITSNAFEHPLGLRTLATDERGANTAYEYDLLGRLQVTTNDLGQTTTQIYDAFKRVIQEINAKGNSISHIFNAATRTQTTVYPEAGTQQVRTKNIFSEDITIIDALNNSQQFTHAAQGEIISTTDALGNTSNTALDLNGRTVQQQDASGLVTQFDRNAAGQLTKQIVDAVPDGLQLTTQHQPNALGQDEQVIDPNNIARVITLDRRGQPLLIVTDPTGLALQTVSSYDGQGQVTSLIQGDAKQTDTYCKASTYDDYGRPIATIVDPAKPTVATCENANDPTPAPLNLTTSHTLDPAGLAIADTDARGNVTRNYYDSLKRPRYKIDPNGGIIAWDYDDVGNKLYERCYDQAVDPTLLTDKTTLADVINLLQNQASALDTVTWFFYDDNQRECFRIDSLGGVQETRYNDVSCPIQTLLYDKTVDVTQINQFTTASLMALTPSLANPVLDRVTYQVFDAKKRARFRFIPDSYDDIKQVQVHIVIEQQFDEMDRIIAETRYATKITNAADLAQLLDTQVRAQLTLDATRDQTTYTVYDKPGRKQYLVKPNRAVIYYDNDDNDNVISSCEFYNPINIPTDYAALVNLVRSLVPDVSKGDRITGYQYDHANRKTSMTDALGYTESYTLDSNGNVIETVDKAGNVWKEVFDRANRSISKTSPQLTITNVTLDTTNPGKLTYAQAQQVVTTKMDYDACDNKVLLTSALNTPESFQYQKQYDARNHAIVTAMPNVPVDDLTQTATLPGATWTRPEQLLTVSAQTKYNAKGYKIAECNEAGQWTFYVRDALNRIIYQVNWKAYIIERQRNRYGEVTKKIRYANSLNIDLTPYTSTGILPATIVQSHLTTNALDRHKIVTRNKQGKPTLIILDQRFYYIPNGSNPYYGYAQPQTKRQYDAFGNRCYQAKLVNPQTQLWAETFVWCDQTNQMVAQCDPAKRIQRYQRNSFTEITRRYEYAKLLTVVVSTNTSLADLDVALLKLADVTDRIYDFVMNALGQVREQRLTSQFTISEPTLNATGIPTLKVVPVTSLSQFFEYTATGLRYKVTNEAGAISYTWFDPRGAKIAETGVPRQSRDANGNTITLVPLTVYGYGNVRQAKTDLPVLRIRYAQGTQVVTNYDPKQPPLPIATAAADQIEINKLTVTSVQVAIQQDAEQRIQQFTYTRTKKIARKWWQLSEWQPGNTMVLHIDETRSRYDELDRPTHQDVLRDNAIVQTTQDVLDAFNQRTASGSGDGTFPMYAHFDTSGNLWNTNVDTGIATIQLTDLADRQTATLQSATDDLSLITATGLLAIMPWNYTRLERTEAELDLGGRAIVKRQPTFTQPDTAQPDDLPIQLHVAQQTQADGSLRMLLSWPVSAHRQVVPELCIWSITDPNNKHVLPIQVVKQRYQIDVTDFAAGDYAYHIDYKRFDLNKLCLTDQVLYQTQGKFVLQTEPALQQTNNLQSLLSATTPQSYEITMPAQLAIVDRYAELRCEVPTELVDYALRFNCTYMTAAGDSYTDTGNVQSGVNIQSVQDNTGQSLQANIVFTHPPETITSFSLALQLSATQELHLLRHAMPLVDDLDEEAENNTCCTALTYAAQQAADTAKTAAKTVANGIHSIANMVQACVQGAIETEKNKTLLTITDNAQIELELLTPGLTTSNNTIQTIKLVTQIITLVGPLPHTTELPFITYLDVSKDNYAKAKLLTVIERVPLSILATATPSTDEAMYIVLNTSALAPGHYPFTLCADHSIPLSQTDYYFSVTRQGQVYASDPAEARLMQTVTTAHQLTYDVWDNVTVELDSLKNRTDSTYDPRNIAIQRTLPAVTITNADGSQQSVRPVTIYGVNRTAKPVGVCDANQHTMALFLDAADQQVKQVLADGVTQFVQDINALGQVIRYWDSRKECWRREYTRTNQLSATTSPSQMRVSRTSYNELDQVASVTNPGGEVTHTIRDPFGNAIITYPASGVDDVVRQTFDRNRQLKTKSSRDGNLSWKFRDNYFSVLAQHTDMSQSVITYGRDFKNQLISQTSQSSNPRMMFILLNVSLTKAEAAFYNLPFPPNIEPTTEVDYVGFVLSSVSNQNLYYSYSGGILLQVQDYTQMQITAYRYDSERRRIYSSLTNTSTGKLEREITSELDSWGREIEFVDNAATVQRGFDAVGNQRMTKAQVAKTTLDPSNVVATRDTITNKESWITTDVANRVLIDNGVLRNGVIQLDISNPGQGIQLSYDQYGFRSGQIYVLDGQPYGSVLKYQKDGLLDTRTFNTSPTEGYLATYTYTLDSQQETYTEYSFQILFNTFFSKMIYANNNSWLSQCYQHNALPPYSTQTIYVSYTAEGQPQAQTTFYNKDFSDLQQMQDIAQLQYTVTDEWLLSQEAAVRELLPKGPSSNIAVKQQFYDVNDNKNLIMGTKNDSGTYDSGAGISQLVSSYDGSVYRKIWQLAVNGQTYSGQFLAGASYIWSEENYFADNSGNIVASWRPENQTDTISGLTIVNYTSPVTQGGSSRKPDAKQSTDHTVSHVNQVLTTTPAWNLPSYPPTTPTMLTSNAGDSYATIAQRAGLDSSWVPLIALVNNGSVDDTLQQGMMIRIPPGVYDNFSNASSRTNLSLFLSIISDSLYPNVKTPEPPHPHKSIFGEVVMVIAAVAVAFVAPYVGAAVVGSITGASTAAVMASTATGVIVAEAVTAAVFVGLANAALQGLAVDMGWQSHFSFSQVAISALLEGVNVGLGQLPAITQLDWASLSPVLMRAGVLAVTNQLAQLAAGRKFDFRAVLSQVVAALTNAVLAPGIPNPLGQQAVGNFVGSLEQWAIQRQAPDMQSILIQTVANTAVTLLAPTILPTMPTAQAQQSSAARPASAYASTDTGPGDAAWTTVDSSPNAAQSNSESSSIYATISNRAPKASPTTTQGYQATSEQPDLRYILDPHSSQAAATPPSPGKLLSDYLLFSPSGTLQTDTQTTKLATTANQVATQTSKAQRWNGQVGNSSLANNDLVMLGPGLLVPRSDITIANTAIGDGASTIAMIVAPEAVAPILARASLFLKDVPLVDRLYRFFAGGVKTTGVGTDTVTLYRAVNPEELAQISQTKTFQNPYGIENKYFSTTQAGAEQYAQMAEKAFSDPPYTIIKTTILKSAFESLSPELQGVVDRGVPAALIPTSQLPILSQPEILSSELKILNRSIP